MFSAGSFIHYLVCSRVQGHSSSGKGIFTLKGPLEYSTLLPVSLSLRTLGSETLSGQGVPLKFPMPKVAVPLSGGIPGASPPHPGQHQPCGLGWLTPGTKTCNLGCKGAYVPHDQEPAEVVSRWLHVAAQGCRPPRWVPGSLQALKNSHFLFSMEMATARLLGLACKFSEGVNVRILGSEPQQPVL